MKYTQIPVDTFKNLQMNAGILTDAFNPATGEIGNLLGATTGGISFSDSMSFTDLGDDIDNCPKNMMELKMLESHDVKISGTFVTMTNSTAHLLAAAADVDAQDETHITPRNDVLLSDYKDIWFIGDYSDDNDGEDAGYIAIHLFNALNTGGFQIKSSDRAKGQFAFEFTGHYSMSAQDTVPYELYVKAGGTATPAISLNPSSVTIGDGDVAIVTATVVPAGTAITWDSSDDTVATVTAAADGKSAVITGAGAGTATITATITVSMVEYTAECAVTVEV